MITSEKIEIFKKYNGNVDMWARLNKKISALLFPLHKYTKYFSKMKLNYFSIRVHIKERLRPLEGIREYATDNNDEVYEMTKKSLLKFYYLTDIIKIDVWPVSESSPLIEQYLKKKELQNIKAKGAGK